MISRSDWEPLPTPTLSPFALARPGTFLRVGFFTAAVWCVPALRVPLVHSLINHFRQKYKYKTHTRGDREQPLQKCLSLEHPCQSQSALLNIYIKTGQPLSGCT